MPSNSGIHFNLELSGEEDELLLHLAQNVWRTHFYSQPYAVVEFIQQNLTSPSNVISRIKKTCRYGIKTSEKSTALF